MLKREDRRRTYGDIEMLDLKKMTADFKKYLESPECAEDLKRMAADMEKRRGPLDSGDWRTLNKVLEFVKSGTPINDDSVYYQKKDYPFTGAAFSKLTYKLQERFTPHDTK